MSVTDMSQLRPDTAGVVHDYLAAVDGALAKAAPEDAATIREDLEAHLLGALDEDSSAEDARSLVLELGDPGDYAEGLELEPLEAADTSPASGTFLGMPYDVRIPTAERIMSRWWNPRDPRVFVPRVFGMGWDINYGSVAVRLHLIEPDAEDEPLAEVPYAAFAAAAAVPVVLTLWVGLSYLVLRTRLPELLPVHWDIAGQVDGWSQAGTAWGTLFALAVVPTGWAVLRLLRAKTGLGRGGALAFASLFATLSASIWTVTLATGLGADVGGWWIPLMLVAVLGVPLVLLTSLARIGRARELERDLGERPGTRVGGRG